MKKLASSHSSLVVIAHLKKRHSFKENKWKALSCSGQSSPWLSKLDKVYLDGIEHSVKIEVPAHKSSEFFIYFDPSFEAMQGAELSVLREQLPELSEHEYYMCDLMGELLQSETGVFKILSYFENGDPSAGVASTTLMIESVDSNSSAKVEVPLSALSKKDNSWFINDIGLWIEISQNKSEKRDDDEDLSE